MTWYAQRLMNVAGKLYDVGDELPSDEVESWRNLRSYINRGWVSGIHDDRVGSSKVSSEVSVDPATDGARQTFPREYPPADKPPTTEPVPSAASGERHAEPAKKVETPPKGTAGVATVVPPKAR